MNLIELFQKLLTFKSITPNDDGAFDFIKDYLGNSWECIDLDIKDTKNRFFYKKFNKVDQHLCFAGHIDVVPVDNWIDDPFSPEIKNGIIKARGAQDMKSGLAAFLYSCKHTINFNGTLSILLTSDEEGEGTYGTIKMLEHLKKINFLPNFSIVAEPTCEKVFGDAIKIGRRGSINGYLKIKGKQGHAAYPEKTINPIHQIASILDKIADINLDQGDKYFQPSKIVITDIRGGSQVTNLTPNRLDIMFNVRNSTNTSKKDIENYFKKYLNNLDYNINLTQNSYPFITNENSKIVKQMEKSIQNILNIKTKHSTAGGTSDARYFGAFGIESIEFGVINDTIHSIKEQTTTKQVEDLSLIFDDIIKKL